MIAPKKSGCNGRRSRYPEIRNGTFRGARLAQRKCSFMLRLIAGYFRFLGLLLLLGALPAVAQDNYTRFEFGTQFSTVRLTNSDLGGTNYSGFGGRFDWNLNRRLAFESQIDFFAEHTIPLLSIQAGQTLQAVFGVRANGIQTRRVSVFGLIRPGLFHFTDVFFFNSTSASGCANRPATPCALNLVRGLALY